MQFFKDLLRNLAILAGLGLVMLILFPDIMSQVFQLYGTLFGSLIFVVVILAALPRKSQSGRYKAR